MTSFPAFLEKTLVRDLVKAKESNTIIYLDENSSVHDALQVLAKNNLISAPVRVSDAVDWLGFIDCLDILRLAIHMYTNGSNNIAEDLKKIDKPEWSSWCRDINTMQHRDVRFGLTPLKKLIAGRPVDTFCPINDMGSVHELIEGILAKGAHRAPVMDDRNDIKAIITQSDIVQLLFNNMDVLGDMKEKSIQELKIGTHEVISMSIEAQAIHAFYLMIYHRVHAVALTHGSSGKLVANLSASDIKGLASENLSSLLLPVKKYLNAHAKLKGVAISVKNDSTLEELITKFALFRVHHVWMLDEQDRAVGVIGLADLMKFCNKCCKEQS
jgi:CBS-domain-containing membrane protein